MSTIQLAQRLGDACYGFLAINFFWGLYCVIMGWRRVAQLSFRSQNQQAAFLNDLMERLQMAGISTRPGTHAVHLLGYYRDRYGFLPDDFPAARDCDANTMAIPLHNRMSTDDYEYVIATLSSF